MSDFEEKPGTSEAVATAYDTLIRQPMMKAIREGQTAGGYAMLPNGEIYQWGTLAGPLLDTNRVPSKVSGRRGTRRAWKRKHPPGWLFRMMGGQ